MRLTMTHPYKLSMKSSIKYIILSFWAILMTLFVFSCSDDTEEMRWPEEIEGVWSPDPTNYLEFSNDNTIHNLKIEYQDDKSIGIWTTDVYFYEPGYNLVIYLTSDHYADVYEIVELTQETMTWCWVDEIEAAGADSIGEIIGEIINKAQEGFTLDPELFESFNKIPQDDFFALLESLNIFYPWGIF